MIRNKFKREEFEVECGKRSYRVIRNFEGKVSVAKWSDLGIPGWWWKHVFSTLDGKEAILEAIDREIPSEDWTEIQLALFLKLGSAEVPAQLV